MKRTDLAYLAGIIDSDGGGYSSDSIDRQKNLFFDIKKLNSLATTECVGSPTREMRQSELDKMKNFQRESRRTFSA